MLIERHFNLQICYLPLIRDHFKLGNSLTQHGAWRGETGQIINSNWTIIPKPYGDVVPAASNWLVLQRWLLAAQASVRWLSIQLVLHLITVLLYICFLCHICPSGSLKG